MEFFLCELWLFLIGESEWNALNGNEIDDIKGTMSEATSMFM